MFLKQSLNELFPNWKELKAPIETKVSKEKFLFLGKNQLAGQHGYCPSSTKS